MIYFVVYFGIGILANLIGPLAKHLSIEGKHALTENKNKSWFYKYSFVLALRVFMTIIYPIFYFSYYILKRKPQEPVSFDDIINNSLVKRLRSI